MSVATQQLNEQEQEAVAALREKAAIQRQHQEQNDRLQHRVDEARDRLSRAEDFKSYAAKRITQIQTLLLSLWGKERIVTNVDPTSQCLDGYNSILTLRAAVEDFPRIKRHLEAELATAKQQFEEFQRQ